LAFTVRFAVTANVGRLTDTLLIAARFGAFGTATVLAAAATPTFGLFTRSSPTQA
jgi:hypothetical protein